MKNAYQKLTDLFSTMRPGEKLIMAIYIVLTLTLSLTTCTEDSEILPKLNTLEVIDTDVTSTTATLKGEILSLGNMKIIEYGIEYSKSTIFSPSLTKGFATAPVTGVYQVEVTNLEPNTLYYYKAYVLINTANVYSPNYAHFTTKQ
jgi:hypothetical protein